MGMVFGKTGVAEPVYESLFVRSKHAKPSWVTKYEIRKYGTRYAIETDNNSDNSAFRLLAGYIGVGGPPQNVGSKSIAMTAPVVTANATDSGKKIAMTAPVTITKSNNSMQFYLPAEFDSMEKIPKPLDDRVKIAQIPPATGAVHTFSGSMSQELAHAKVTALMEQLEQDGVEFSNKEDVMTNYLLWQFNPPFTIPFLRRNEIWIPLTEEEVKAHLERFARSGNNDNDDQ